MRAARSVRLSGIGVMCLAAIGCNGAGMSGPADPVSGQDAADRAESSASKPTGPSAGVAIGSNAGSGAAAMMVWTTGSSVGVAGRAAEPTAGAAGAVRAGQLGQAGQAGVATAGGSSSQAGTGGVSMPASAAAGAAAAGAGAMHGAAAGTAGGAGASASDACPSLPGPLYVKNGAAVSGAGCNQQWEGIVMTNGGRGLCTASFISDRHLISASHCYASDGPVSLQVSAPTWDNGMRHPFQAQVKRSGPEMELDIAIIDLGKAVDWATPERRFLLHAGTAEPSDLHLYGFGQSSTTGGAGTLRGTPKRATVHVTDTGMGTLTGMSADAQLCEGDSGGPATREMTAAVIYGINQGADPPGNIGFGTCAEADWTLVFTNVGKYIAFTEQALGKPCSRKQVDGLDVAQCW